MRVLWQNKYTVLAFLMWGKLWKNTTELLASTISTIELLGVNIVYLEISLLY